MGAAVIALLGLVFAVSSAILGLLTRLVYRSARDEERLRVAVRDLAQLAATTSERLTYLERNAWPPRDRKPR